MILLIMKLAKGLDGSSSLECRNEYSLRTMIHEIVFGDRNYTPPLNAPPLPAAVVLLILFFENNYTNNLH